MGRVLAGGSIGSSGSVLGLVGSVTAGVAACLAGEQITEADLLVLAAEGMCYKYQSNDTSIVANAGTAIFPATSITNNGTDYKLNINNAAIIHSDSHVYAFKSTGAVATIVKLDKKGNIIASVDVSSGATGVAGGRLVELSNGSIAATWIEGNPRYLFFAIISPHDTTKKGILDIVKAKLSTYYISSIVQYGLAAIPTGGCVITGADYNNASVYMTIFDNVGAVLKDKVVWGTTATSDPAGTTVAVLSNGNIAMIRSGGTANVNTKIAIYNQAGAPVLAEIQLTTTCSADQFFKFIIGSGFFALAIGNSLRIYNNAGALQGAAITNLGGPSYQPLACLWDGTSFQCFYASATDKAVYRATISTLGVLVTTKWICSWTADNAGTGYSIDAKATTTGDIAILVVSQIASPGVTHGVVIDVDCNMLTAFQSVFTVTDAQSLRPTIIFSDKFSLLVSWTYPSVLGLVSMKMINTALLGVAASSAAEGELAAVYVASGTYPINTVQGDSPKTVDHSTANITGNKGLILTNAAILRGM
jgi:hypothetical protein